MTQNKNGNKGKKYYACSRQEKDRCNFVNWATMRPTNVTHRQTVPNRSSSSNHEDRGPRSGGESHSHTNSSTDIHRRTLTKTRKPNFAQSNIRPAQLNYVRESEENLFFIIKDKTLPWPKSLYLLHCWKRM